MSPRQRQAAASHAYAADQALGVLRFHRDVSMGQFLEGIADDHRRAVEAGLLADSTRRALADELPVWYAFLEDRGVKDGDRIVYRFEPDRVRATYVGADGRTYLDRTSEGAQRKASVLGAYFAPGASLREGLLDSLFREGRDGADRCRVLQDEWSGR